LTCRSETRLSARLSWHLPFPAYGKQDDMPINHVDVEAFLYDNIPLKRLAAAAPAKITEREHTKMYLDEIQLRYPAAPPPQNLVTQSINAINANVRITPALVRAQITNQEVALALAPTAPVVPAPVGALANFLARLEARRGAYNWSPGSSVDFTNWINGLMPLANPLGDNATINCWEAVLVAAAEANVVTILALTNAYAAPNRNISVENLLTANGFTQINHTPHTAGVNNIQAGQVILIDDEAERMHHVVAALVPNPADYHGVIVMSHWGNAGGNVFCKVPLDNVLSPNNTIRYATL
jgi:hypothetical protein